MAGEVKTIYIIMLCVSLRGAATANLVTSKGHNTSVALVCRPNKIEQMIEGTFQLVNCNITGVSGSDAAWLNIHVELLSRDTAVATITESTPRILLGSPKLIDYEVPNTTSTGGYVSLTLNETGPVVGANFTVYGKRLGKTTVRIQVVRGEFVPMSEEYPVSVIRAQQQVYAIFYMCLVFVLLIVNIMMGIKTDLTIVRAVLKKPIQPVIGVCSQFIAMPLISLGIAKLFSLPSNLGFGLLAVGCSPGGGASNVFTYLLAGDLSLSITMTFISTIISLGMTTFWIWALGPFFMDEHLEITGEPALNILRSLAIIVPPLCIGVLLKRFRPLWAKKCIKVMMPVTIVLMIAFIPFGVWVNWYIWELLTWTEILCGVILSSAGYIVGGLFAFAFRQTWKRIRTIAIEVGLQNVGIAMVIIRYALKQPDGDMTVSMAVACSLVQTNPLVVATVAYQIYKRRCRNKEKAVPLDDYSVVATEDRKTIKNGIEQKEVEMNEL